MKPYKTLITILLVEKMTLIVVDEISTVFFLIKKKKIKQQELYIMIRVNCIGDTMLRAIIIFKLRAIIIFNSILGGMWSVATTTKMTYQ